MKTKLYIISSLLFFSLLTKGQTVINITLSPSMSEHAYIKITQLDSNKLSVVFTQRDITDRNRKKTLAIMDKYFKDSNLKQDSILAVVQSLEYISLWDSCTFSSNKNDSLFRAFNNLLSNCDTLSKLKDERLVIDGFRSYLKIASFGKDFNLFYLSPPTKYNLPIYQLIIQVLKDLKKYSENKNVRNYCRFILSSYLRGSKAPLGSDESLNSKPPLIDILNIYHPNTAI